MMRFLLVAFGLLISVFAHPKLRNSILARFFNEGLITPRVAKPEKDEIIKFAGPNLSVLAIGIVLILLGLILR